MSIFAKPQEIQNDNNFGVKVLFLHGLEGSPNGEKSRHMQAKWGALVPHLRTTDLRNLKEKCRNQWHLADAEDLEEALSTPYQDALDAVQYCKPDIIVGSSMGAALLYKLYAEEAYSGSGVFLAPAIPNLLSSEEITSATKNVKNHSTFWLFGETDTIVSNKENARIAKLCKGSIAYSPEDGHRLKSATASGLIDSAILTVIEMSQVN